MFAIINICAYILFGIGISLKKKVNFIYSIPIVNCFLILVLFALAVVNKMQYIIYISIFVSIVSLYFIIKDFDYEFIKGHLYYATTYAFIFGILILIVYVRKRLVSDWDELGVWALETKMLYFLNGFDRSDRIVALGYSNYNPAQMLFESWVCRLGGDTLIEGLMYVGYYYLYLSFCLPILGKIKSNKIYKSMIIGLALPLIFLVIPSSVETYGYIFLSVELLISAGFALLLHLLLSEDCDEGIKYILIFSTSTLIMFAKESGVLFIIIGLIISMFIYKTYNNQKIINVKLIITFLISGIPTILWGIYCKKNMRSNYFVSIGNSVEGAKGNIGELKKYIRIIFRTLYTEPLHSERTTCFDLTIVLFIVLIIGIMIIYFKYEIMNKREIISFISCYIVLLIIGFCGMAYMHAYIFAEDQYYETSVMIKSLCRYLEPMFTGVFIYILTMPLVRGKYNKYIILGLLCVILCTARYESVNKGIFNTNKIVSVAKNDKKAINEMCGNLIESLNGSDNSRKVLFITTGENYYSERRLRYEVCPTPIECVDMSLTENAVEEVKQCVLFYTWDNQYTDIYFAGFSDEILQSALGENVLSNELLSVDSFVY